MQVITLVFANDSMVKWTFPLSGFLHRLRLSIIHKLKQLRRIQIILPAVVNYSVPVPFNGQHLIYLPVRKDKELRLAQIFRSNPQLHLASIITVSRALSTNAISKTSTGS